MGATERLSGQDLANLLVEAPDTPMHMGVLTVFEGGHGLDSPDRLLPDVREHVAARLSSLPELRRVLRSDRVPGRRPRWSDHRAFRVEEHVLHAAVESPGDEQQLLAAASDLLERLLDRARPLWEIWVLTGLGEGRWATLLKVHHSLTDGYGMLQIALALFDGGAEPLLRSPAGDQPRPSTIRRLLAPVTSAFALITTFASVVHRTWHGRRARLLRPIGAQRRLEVVSLDLASVKSAAHAHGVKVNDVLLALAARGIAAAITSRGESTRGVVLRALMAVSPSVWRRNLIHNQAGSIVVSLPLEAANAAEQLAAIGADSRRARRWQRSALIEDGMVFVARSRVGRFLSRHQRVVDLAVSNLVGPAAELHLLGDRMSAAIPITPISGNVTIDFCALSYAGSLSVGILADGDAWPDLAAVAAGMRDCAADLDLRLANPRAAATVMTP